MYTAGPVETDSENTYTQIIIGYDETQWNYCIYRKLIADFRNIVISKNFLVMFADESSSSPIIFVEAERLNI